MQPLRRAARVYVKDRSWKEVRSATGLYSKRDCARDAYRAKWSSLWKAREMSTVTKDLDIEAIVRGEEPARRTRSPTAERLHH